MARLVSHESSNQIEKILKEFPPPPEDGGMLFDSLKYYMPATLIFLVDTLFITVYLST